MASAAATGPLQPAARPPSMLDTLFDVLGNATGRFDQLTGARIDAHALNAVTKSLIREPLHEVDEINEGARNAYRRGRNAAYLATHPRAAVHALDTALRKSGRGRQLDNFYNNAGMAYYYGRKGFGFAKDLYKKFDDFTSEPYPAKEKGLLGFLDKAQWTAGDWADKVDNALTIVKILNRARKKLWGLHPFFPKTVKGGEHLSDKWLGPFAILSDVVTTGKDLYRKQWGKAAYNTAWGVWDTISTDAAWGGPISRWATARGGWIKMARSAARQTLRGGGRLIKNLARGGVQLGTRLLRGAGQLGGRLLRGGAQLGSRLWTRLATRLGGRAGMQIMERAAVQSLERAGVQAGEKVGMRLLSNPYVAAAAALAAVAYGGYWAYKHPKETRQFFHDAGDFFHNVRVGLNGTPKEKAKGGWHPWADYVSSEINVVRDLATLHFKKASEDASSWKHAVNKIAGLEPPPGGKAMRPQDIWQNKTFRFINDDLLPALDPMGFTPHMDVDQMKSTSEWLQGHLQASPQAPVLRSRPSTQLHAPLSGRSPQPRRQGAGNTPTKTQAEIRVRFDNLPPGPRIGSRAPGAGTQVETGMQFAF